MTWVFDEIKKGRDRPFCFYRKRSFSYEELALAIEMAEENLQRRGVPVGKIVAIGGDYGLLAVAVLLALYRRGNIAVPLTGDSISETGRRIEAAGAEWFVVVEPCDEKFQTLWQGEREPAPVVRQLQEQERSGLILFSSGSAGMPKGMLHDFDHLVNSYRPTKLKDHRVLAFMELDHIGGLDIVFRALASKSALVLPLERTPEEICQLIERHRADVLPATPSFLNLLLLSEAYRSHNLSSLKIIAFGAEKMSDLVLARLRKVFPNVEFQQKFGTSETNAVRMINSPDDPLWMRIEDRSVEWKIVDGELWLKTPSLILGYLKEESGSLLTDGWYRTGDLVEEREDGFFRIIGRKVAVINVGGEKVLPSEVEETIREVEGVADCRVYGESSAILGEVVHAEVRPMPGLKERELIGEIREYCRKHLEAYKVPVKVEIVKEFALTSAGKKMRRGI